MWKKIGYSDSDSLPFFSGFSPLLISCFEFQVSEFIESKELPRVLDWLKTVTPDTLPAESVPTFAVGQVLMGDLLFTPLAYYFVEKAVNANSISLKVS